MKKSYLWTGVGMTALGICCLLAALLLDTPLDSILCGLFGAFTAPGLLQIYKYFKWGHSPEYRAKLEEEEIDLRDERKEMLRDRAGRLAYLLGLLVTAAAVLVFSVLGSLGILADVRPMELYLASFLVMEYLAGIVFYRRLEKRY